MTQTTAQMATETATTITLLSTMVETGTTTSTITTQTPPAYNPNTTISAIAGTTAAETTETPPETKTLSTTIPSSPTSTPGTSPSTAKTPTTPPHPCDPSPCRNGATCVDLGNTTYNCICAPGFTAQNCDVEINECETNPCYPFGKCTDLIGDYNCTCNPGYEPLPNNTKTCTETNFCAVEDQPCLNGGTCVNQNALSRYYCLCPTDNDRQYVGLHCETVLVTKPTVNGGISPTSGIIAGGATVTIRGQGLDLFEPLGAYLIDTPTTGNPKSTLYAYVIPNLTLSDSIAVQIPPADVAYVDLYLLMIVEYTGPINVTSDTENLRFKYTGNPVITTIEPTVILVSGGVHLTVSGSNMDTVQNPMMDITTFVVNKTTGTSEDNFRRESCSVKNATAITCLIPQGIVPSSFINNTESVGKSLRGVAHLESLFRHKRGRRTKRAPVANLTDDTGSTFEMYLGFIFDQYPTYNNISKSLPHVTLSFVPPQISFNPGCSMDFISNKQDTISLYGKALTYGCSLEDYQVNISDVKCVVTSLTDNELQCRPPEKEPQKSDNAMRCASDPHPVMVYVGDRSYHGCCVSYTTDNTVLIIGVTVICVVVVVVIILVAVLCYKRHRKNQENDVTILTLLNRKLFRQSTKMENIFVNHDAPPNLVQEAINRAARNDSHVRTDVSQPRDEMMSSTTVDGPTSAADGYLVPNSDDEDSRSDRSNVGVNPNNDYLMLVDQPVFSSNDGIGDNSGDSSSSSRSRDQFANIDNNGEGPIGDPDYLILNNTETNDAYAVSDVPTEGPDTWPMGGLEPYNTIQGDMKISYTDETLV